MMKPTYNTKEFSILKTPYGEIYSFQNGDNIDVKTVESFGSEWTKFNEFNDKELLNIGEEYFDICDDILPNKNWYVLDVGCGTGRWTKFVCDKVGFVEAVDPSEAIYVAQQNLLNKANTRVTRADVSNLPFNPETFDFVFSLGVLHHLPDTQKAINDCVRMIKPGGYFLVYLYYSLDNRGFVYKSIFAVSNFFRLIISRLPIFLKKLICDIIAVFVYMPFILFSRFLSQIPFISKYSDSIPLAYYKNKSFWIIRNDALDRFGTPLEQRFSKLEIQLMLEKAGLKDIIFSENAPFWHARGKKA